MRRPSYRRGLTYVAVRTIYIRNAGVMIKAGEEIPPEYRSSTVRRWVNRGFAGPVDSRWTEEMLEKGEQRQARILASNPTAEEIANADEEGSQAGNEGNDEGAEDDSEDESDQPVIEELGGGWYNVTILGEVTKVQGKDALDELMDSLKG